MRIIKKERNFAMKKLKYDLAEREQEILNLLWNTESGLTSVDILEQSPEIMKNSTYIHRALTVLEEKGLIEVCGTVRYNKQYARKFKVSLTKEEFAAGLLCERGFSVNSLNGIAAAFIKCSSKGNEDMKQAAIHKLKEMIEHLESENEN